MGLDFNTNGLGKVLDALKNNIMRNTHVATFGIVRETNDDVAYVEFIPVIDKNNTTNVMCFNASPFALEVGDLVIVIFMDRNYRQNVKQYLANKALSELTTNDILHSIEYGVIVSKVGAEITDNKYPINWSSSFSSNTLSQTLTMSDGSTLTNSVSITFDAPVTSVNGKTGAVVLTLEDLGDFPPVVFSGSYNDLYDKPTVYQETVQGDMLSHVFNNITPQLQTNTPDASEYSYWYKINETNGLQQRSNNDIIILDDNEEETLLKGTQFLLKGDK